VVTVTNFQVLIPHTYYYYYYYYFAFANCFKSIFNTTYPSVTLSYPIISDVLPTAPISAAEASRAIKRLRPSKCVGLDGIPSFIIKGCSDIFLLLLTYIFHLNATSGTFLSLWKQTAVIPVFKKGDSTIVSNYRPISILKIFPKYLSALFMIIYLFF
jgi:hypothetical protein